MRFAPSLLAADGSRLDEAISLAEGAGAHGLHVDVMDGHFVPNIAFGPDLVARIRTRTNLPLSVHLMVTQPYMWWSRYPGADVIALHPEVFDALGDFRATVAQIISGGQQVWAAVSPQIALTPVFLDALSDCHGILVMGVQPGFSGQGMLSGTRERVERFRAALPQHVIAIDGGLNLGCVRELAAAGASWGILGAAFYHADNPAATLRECVAASTLA